MASLEPQPGTEQRTRSQPFQRANTIPDDFLDLFRPCARCSAFVAGYRLLCDDLGQALETAEGNWATLSWSQEVRRLIGHSFGHAVDVELLYYSSCCPECRRPFVYEAASEETPADRLRLALRMR